MTLSTAPPPEEAIKLLARALESFLHFSPLNSWLLRDRGARSRLRCRLREPSDAPAVQPLGPSSNKNFAPLQLGQSQLLLEVQFQTEHPGAPWFAPRAGAAVVVPGSAGVTPSSPRSAASTSPRAAPSPSEKRERPDTFDQVSTRRAPPLRRGGAAESSSDLQQITVRAEGARAAATGFFGEPDAGASMHSPDPRRRRPFGQPPRSPPSSPPRSSRSPGSPGSSSAPIPISPGKGSGLVVRGDARGKRPTVSPPRSSLSWARSFSGVASSGSGALPHAHGRITDESPPRKAYGSGSGMFAVSRTSSLDSSMLAMMASRRLLGSFEESLLSGRMSHSASSAVTGFMAEIGACGAGKTPKHITLDLPAAFYKLPGESSPSPYVGKIQLDDGHEAMPGGRYRVPTHGLVQVMIYNPERTGIKVFLVKYDFRDMPRRSRTFLRQRTFVETEDRDADGERRRRLLYAIHLRFVCTRVGRVYLHKDIRVVFTHRAPDPSEKIKTITEGPSNPVYSPAVGSVSGSSSGPSGKLHALRRARHLSDSGVDPVVMPSLADLELE